MTLWAENNFDDIGLLGKRNSVNFAASELTIYKIPVRQAPEFFALLICILILIKRTHYFLFATFTSKY